MRNPELGQLYAAGDAMGVRVNFEERGYPRLRPYEVETMVADKLRAVGLYAPDDDPYRTDSVAQRLHVSIVLDDSRFVILMSLRRWTDDPIYGVPGEITVWVFSDGDRHQGSGFKVLERLGWCLDNFIRLYQQAQRACMM